MQYQKELWLLVKVGESERDVHFVLNCFKPYGLISPVKSVFPMKLGEVKVEGKAILT